MAATDADRDAFVAVARSYVGTPFHHEGRLPGVGLDCIGSPVCAGIASGFDVRDVRGYPLRPNGMLKKMLDERLINVPTMLTGDLLLMRFDHEEPHHLAIFTGKTIIHAHVIARKCVEQDWTDYWADRTVGIYRFPELL